MTEILIAIVAFMAGGMVAITTFVAAKNKNIVRKVKLKLCAKWLYEEGIVLPKESGGKYE